MSRNHEKELRTFWQSHELLDERDMLYLVSTGLLWQFTCSRPGQAWYRNVANTSRRPRTQLTLANRMRRHVAHVSVLYAYHGHCVRGTSWIRRRVALC